MTTCPACGSTVEARWKFCIRCGAPSTAGRPPVQRGAGDEPGREQTREQGEQQATGRSPRAPWIPSAIRPSALDEADDDHDLLPEHDQARVDLPRAIGIALAVAGLALIVYMAVALSGGL
jgi:hypothetical protein